jgi:transposase
MKMFIEPNDIYLHSGFVDFRKSINGLLVIIEYELELSPFNDALFIFCNKKQNKIKLFTGINPATALGLCALVQSAAKKSV